jgi:glycosyltransferase involved in cell wall biosynthesis
MKYIFVVRQLNTGGAETATILLGQELSSRGAEIEVWNLGSPSKEDLHRWNTWAVVKQKSKYSLLFYRKTTHEQLILVNNVGHRYAPINSAISILHGDCCHDLKNATTYFKIFEQRLKIYRMFSKRRNIIISKPLAKELANYTKHQPKYIANPFNADFVRAQAKDPLSIGLPDKFIIHVGRISHQKRQDILLKEYCNSIELQNSADLVFVGGEHNINNPLLPNLYKIVADNNLHDKVHFLGDQANPWPIMQRALCLVLCSDFESMGYVLLEAMELGIPIVSTDVQGPKEVLGDDFPGLVKAGECLSSRICEAIENPTKFIKTLPNRYCVEKVADEFERYILSTQKA